MLIKRSLDADGCIDLLAVMRIMNQISQEQAWALAYELAALMQRLWPAGDSCLLIENLAQIHINQEGWIHSKSLLRNCLVDNKPATTGEQQPEEEEEVKQNDDEQKTTSSSNQQINQQLPPTPPITPELEALAERNKLLSKESAEAEDNQQQQQQQQLLIASSESELVGSLGIALFWALDYGLAEDEERKLSAAMEYLIMQSQNPDGHLTLDKVQEICIKRLPVPTKSNADKHYRQLCKSLIGDTLELSKLLDKIDNSLVIYAEAAAHLHHHLQQQQQQQQQQHHHHHHLHHHNSFTSPTTNHLLARHLVVDQHLVDQDDLSELGLPLACLKALKINDWARLWMQVNRELRQRRKFNQIHHRMHQYEFHSERKTTPAATPTTS